MSETTKTCTTETGERREQSEALLQLAGLTGNPRLLLAWARAELDRQMAGSGEVDDDDDTEVPF